MKPLPQPKVRSGQAAPAGRRGVPPRRWPTGQPSRRHLRLGLRLAGAGLLVASGAIHLDLYLTGYQSIPTIGWLFLLPVVPALRLPPAAFPPGGRLGAPAGAGRLPRARRRALPA